MQSLKPKNKLSILPNHQFGDSSTQSNSKEEEVRKARLQETKFHIRMLGVLTVYINIDFRVAVK